LGGSDESDPYLDIPKRYAETALGLKNREEAREESYA
jgi:hypothetical protein